MEVVILESAGCNSFVFMHVTNEFTLEKFFSFSLAFLEFCLRESVCSRSAVWAICLIRSGPILQPEVIGSP
jgi:hypothetical protein